MNLMFESALRQGKLLPSLAGTSSHEVRLTLEGMVREPAFVRFLETLTEETTRSFSTYDFLALHCLYREQPLPDHLKARLPGLIAAGAVESVGRGKGTRYLLSRFLYAALGAKGVYTRKKGLDRETNKALLLQHLRDQGDAGSPLFELRQVLPSESESGVQRLLEELRREARVTLRGRRRWARWVIATSKAQSSEPNVGR